MHSAYDMCIPYIRMICLIMYSPHRADLCVSPILYTFEEECVEDGGEVTMNMYIEGTDEQNDIEDLAAKCCSKSLSGSSETSSISMGEDGVFIAGRFL